MTRGAFNTASHAMRVQPSKVVLRQLLLALLVAVFGCGSSNETPGASSGAGAGGASGSGGLSASGGTSGASAGNDCPASCDDGFPCTVDACVNGTCTHAIGPANGATACPKGQYCVVQDGCVAAPACAKVADCTAAWAGDACKASIRCDAASSVCLFDLLDKDGDGHSPQVCGGDDCDDSVTTILPGQFELCDGKDNDCDGRVDEAEGNPCGSDSAGTCMNGICSCDAVHDCNGECASFSNNSRHCGQCGHACASGSCVGGKCACEGNGVLCQADGGEACVDLATDAANCGACGTACTDKDSCIEGKCQRACYPSYMVDTCGADQVCVVWNIPGSGPSGEAQWASCVPDPCPGEPLRRDGVSGKDSCAVCAQGICPVGVQPCEALGISKVYCSR